jgi:hypothetical protein
VSFPVTRDERERPADPWTIRRSNHPTPDVYWPESLRNLDWLHAGTANGNVTKTLHAPWHSTAHPDTGRPRRRR